MTVYDFDNTIYNGESTVDFAFFIFKRNKAIARFMPSIIYSAILYKLRILNADKLYDITNKMSKDVIKNKDLIASYVKEFWELNEHKLKAQFLNMLTEEDVIVTSSPRFLIEGISSKLKAKRIICSEYNIDNGRFEFICFKDNKVKRFQELYPNITVKSFYTDSYNDKAFMDISESAYLVKKSKIKKIK